MKARARLFLMTALLVLIGGGAYWLLFGGPHRFAEFPLSEESLSHLKAVASVSPQLNTPENMADEYLHGLCHPSDRPKISDLDISRSTGENECVVTIINRNCKDDSLHVICDRIILQKQGGLWLPVKHQAAWQARGQVGWTTKPCS